MSSWEEVKRLAADFQKVQLGSTTQRLSERNCIEIISWLKDRKMIDLIFTVDGKECMTPDQLIKDIQDELYVNGGRINLVDLARIIGVDLAHINNHLGTILKNQKGLHSILGQLIDSSYITKIVSEINEKLSQQGQISVNELTIQYDLPSDFLQQILEKNLNKLLKGKQDPNDPKIFFTESFIARSVAKIRGALFGLTKPTSVATILSQINVNEKLFFTLFEQSCNSCGCLTSKMVGAQYIPNIYAKSQTEWVCNFYTQNSYLEYDALKRLGISDYKNYVKKQFMTEKLIYLSSCLVSVEILDRLLDEIEDCISSKTFVEISSILPSIFNEDDVNLLMEHVMTPQRKQQIIFLENYVLSLTFVEDLMGNFTEILEGNAKKIVESGQYQEFKMKSYVNTSKNEKFEEKVDNKREERRKKATMGKLGGGSQGRETKTKSTKKVRKVSDHEFPEKKEMATTLEVISLREIIEILRGKFNEIDTNLNEIVEEISEFIHVRLNETGMKIAEKIYETTVANRTSNRKETHNELQQKLNNLIGDVRLFEKGIKILPFEDLQAQLYKYLLKTLCTDVVNEILNYLAEENNLTTNFVNNDQRMKFLNELPSDLSNLLNPLIKSLNSNNIDEFMSSIDGGLSTCSMIIKKIDKKKDRIVVLNHRHELLEQLNKCDDLPLILHLAVMVIFTTATQCMLHASGRHLHKILMYLKQFLSVEDVTELNSYYDYVTLMLSGGSEEENVRQKLKEIVPNIRKIANDFKKSTSNEKS